jgi:hypothetical protein
LILYIVLIFVPFISMCLVLYIWWLMIIITLINLFVLLINLFNFDCSIMSTLLLSSEASSQLLSPSNFHCLHGFSSWIDLCLC